MKRILYLGDTSPGSTSAHRLAALGRLGHDVVAINPEARLRSAGKVLQRFHYITGYVAYAWREAARIGRSVRGKKYDVIWVDGGACVDKTLLYGLKRGAGQLINYNVDDPTGDRDGNKWWTFRRALRLYDLAVVVRKESEVEYKEFGAKKILRVFRSYDPVEHAPVVLTDSERALNAKVLFVGAWMPGRGQFMEALLNLGVPLTVRGNGWAKAPEWPRIKDFCQPAALGREYVASIQSADVCIGLVSEANRDLHTQRSAEIPFIGTVFCGKKTEEHIEMFADGVEAVLWTSVEECARHCHNLLAHSAWRQAVAAAGRKRILDLGLSNDLVMERVMAVGHK